MSLFIAMVVLGTPELPSLDSVKTALASQNLSSLERRSGVVSFDLDGVQINCGLVEAPIPNGELQGPLATSPYWQEDDAKVLEHKAHFIVAASADIEKKQLALTLTKAIAGLLRATESSIAVYWGAGSLVTQKNVFCDFSDASTIDQLPLYLWIDFRCFKTGDSCGLFTKGMESLGFMELEVSASKLSVTDTIGAVFNIAHYLLDFGPVLKNGDTIGLSADQKTKITHVLSEHYPSQTVYKVHL